MAAPAGAPARHTTSLKREVGLVGLTWASMGSIIGSGWLFGAQKALIVAGPAAIISWVIGGVVILVLALVHAELGGMYPVSGGTARFPHYAFGGFAGASFGWFSWLQAATVAPIEVSAMITYGQHYSFAHGWLDPKTGVLTTSGLIVAILLMAFLTSINFLGHPAAGDREQRRDVVEGGDPAADHLRARPRELPHLELHRRQRLQPRQGPRHPRRGLDRRHHLQLPRLRAGRPARRREQEPPPRHPDRHHRLDRARHHHLHRAAGRVPAARCPSSAIGSTWDDTSSAAYYTVFTGPFAEIATLVGPGLAGGASCTPTPSSRRPAPA